jgi:hypothetical protein
MINEECVEMSNFSQNSDAIVFKLMLLMIAMWMAFLFHILYLCYKRRI